VPVHGEYSGLSTNPRLGLSGIVRLVPVRPVFPSSAIALCPYCAPALHMIIIQSSTKQKK
jgi:hypothetical protein